MEGEMWVDCKQERLATFNGRLTQDVKFGLGLLGHLDKGGHFEVRQAEVVPGHWDMTTMNLEMTGRALLFKSFEVQKKENRRDFHQVSDDLTLTQAADLLNKHTVIIASRAAHHPRQLERRKNSKNGICSLEARCYADGWH